VAPLYFSWHGSTLSLVGRMNNLGFYYKTNCRVIKVVAHGPMVALPTVMGPTWEPTLRAPEIGVLLFFYTASCLKIGPPVGQVVQLD